RARSQFRHAGTRYPPGGPRHRSSAQVPGRGGEGDGHPPGLAAGARRSLPAPRALRRPAEGSRDGPGPYPQRNRQRRGGMIRVTRLPNGFTVASDRMDSVETVSLGVWADVGTRNQPAEINGVSHLLEHMAFKGTERRSARAIAEEIEAVGGHLNAYTAREQTAYYAKILAGDLPLAVDIIGDILQHSTFDAEELARE